MKAKLVNESMSGIKNPMQVQPGDHTLDYNDEEGIVKWIVQYPSPEFNELVSEDDEIIDYIDEGDWVMRVSGDEYGPFGGPGSVIFSYGYDGAYVPQ